MGEDDPTTNADTYRKVNIAGMTCGSKKLAKKENFRMKLGGLPRAMLRLEDNDIKNGRERGPEKNIPDEINIPKKVNKKKRGEETNQLVATYHLQR